MAAQFGREDIVERLVAHGAKGAATMAYRPTAQRRAAVSDEVGVATVSLENKAEINAADAAGRQPLHLAVKCKISAMVKFLRENKAEVEIQDVTGRTPRSLAENDGIAASQPCLPDRVTMKIGEACSWGGDSHA